MPPDYHAKPVLAVRVDAELQDWGRAEAKRRGQRFGDFVAALFAAERDRIAKPPPVVAAKPAQPRTTAAHALNCKCGICKPPKNGDKR